MKTRILILILLFIFMAPAEAATELDQDIIVINAITVNITAIPGETNSTINPANGSLSPTMRTKFRVERYSGRTGELALQATVNTLTGGVNGFFRNGSNYYLILGNASALPSAAAITNITGTPAVASNANAIAYGFTVTTTPSGTLNSLSWRSVSSKNSIVLSLNFDDCEELNVIGTVGAPYTNTYSLTNDSPGSYQAVITLTANGL